MQSARASKKVTIILGQATGEHGKQTYLRVLERLKSEGAERVAVFKAIASVDGREGVHTLRLAEVVPDLPVMIVWIDAAERVERTLPRILDLVVEGTVAVEDVQVLVERTSVLPDLSGSLTVRDVMTRDVTAVHTSTRLSDLVNDLIGKPFRAVPVIDDDRCVVGIVTNGDLLRRGGLPLPLSLLQSIDGAGMYDEARNLETRVRTAGDMMTSPVVTVHFDLGIRQAAQLMQAHKLKRLPVVNAAGTLVGIVSRIDLLRTVAMSVPDTGEAYQAGAVDGSAPIGSIMSTEAPVVDADASISEVLSVVTSTRLHRAVVVDASRRVLGLVRSAELLARLLPHQRRHLLPVLARMVPFVHGSRENTDLPDGAEGIRARDIMITDILIAHVQDPVRDVLAGMVRRQAKIVPVVNAGGQLAGVVDRADLLRVLSSE
jgi:CBS-domain-containing membrane protein